MLAEHWSTQGMPGGCQDEMEPLQSQLGEAQKGLAARANCEENFHDAREAPLLHPASLKLFTLNLFLMETTVQHLLRQHVHTEGPMPQQRPPKPAWAKAAFFWELLSTIVIRFANRLVTRSSLLVGPSAAVPSCYHPCMFEPREAKPINTFVTYIPIIGQAAGAPSNPFVRNSGYSAKTPPSPATSDGRH